MGYCVEEGLAGPKRLARLKREGAPRAVIQAERRNIRIRKLARKGAKLATGSAGQRREFATLTQRVREGTATRKETRMVGGAAGTTQATQEAVTRVTRKRGIAEGSDERFRAAQEAAAAAASAAADRAARAAVERETRAAQAAQEREQRAADLDAERQIREADRAEARRLSDEERAIAIEEADLERSYFVDDGYPAPEPAYGGGGGGGGGAPWVVGGRAPVNGEARPTPPAAGLLPLAAGAALLFLGS